MILSPKTVVYDLKAGRDGTFLTLVSTATRRRLTHDQAVGLTFLPEIFYPVSAPGSRVATWRVEGLPMRAARALFQANIRNIDDIDRIEEIARSQAAEKKLLEISEQMQEVGRILKAHLEAAGGYLLPTPAPRAAFNLARIEAARAADTAAQQVS